MRAAVEYLLKNQREMFAAPLGKHEVCPEFFYLIQEYEPKAENLWEAHEKYVDIQIVVSGEEIIEVADRSHLKALEPYAPEKDFIGFEGAPMIISTLKAGDLAVYYPADAHKPGLRSKGYGGMVRKCVVKILIA